MSPLRLVVLAILFYIAYRLIVGGRKKGKSELGKKEGIGGNMPTSDVLEEDPICRRLVPRGQAQRIRVGEKTYYFCSNECCETFRKQQGESS